MKKKKKMKVSQTTHKIFTWDSMNPEVQKKSFIGLQDLTKILPSTSSKFTNSQFKNLGLQGKRMWSLSNGFLMIMGSNPKYFKFKKSPRFNSRHKCLKNNQSYHFEVNFKFSQKFITIFIIIINFRWFKNLF